MDVLRGDHGVEKTELSGGCLLVEIKPGQGRKFCGLHRCALQQFPSY